MHAHCELNNCVCDSGFSVPEDFLPTGDLYGCSGERSAQAKKKKKTKKYCSFVLKRRKEWRLWLETDFVNRFLYFFLQISTPHYKSSARYAKAG